MMLTVPFAVLLALPVSWSPGVQGAGLSPAQVARLRSVSTAVISPDGGRLAYTLSAPREPMVDEDGGAWSELHVLDLAQDSDRTYVGGKSGVSKVEFSPDGGTLYFLEKRDDDKTVCLYGISLAGGEARRALKLATSLSDYSLSPDGKRAAVIAVEAEDAQAKRAADKGFKQEVYEEDYRQPRLYVLELFGENRQARPLEVLGSINQVEWSPVDDRLALAVSRTPLVDDVMMGSRVRIVDAGDGKTRAQFDNPGKLGQIAWSPDGRWIACVSAADENDTAAGRIFCAPSAGGEFTNLLSAYAGHVEQLAWLDKNRLAFVAAQGVWSYMGVVGAPQSGLEPMQLLGPGGAVMTALSASADGKTLGLVGSTPAHPAECFTLGVGEVAAQRRTRSNPGLDDVQLALQEVVRFTARDGVTEIESILIRPLDEKPATRYPLILNVHGGPESCQSNGWLTGYANPGQMAAARGFAVLHVNYRGSTGRGVKFAKLSQGDPAGAEFDDLVDAVKHMIGTGLVDPERVGVTGGSYGGYATAWLCTKYSELFAAGVMFVGISDKISKLGTTDIPNEEYLVHTRTHPWDDWTLMLERSPIFYADKCKTPLLILGGKDDPRVDPGQSRELYRHLKLRGQAPVRLVRYPGEGHGNRKAAARFDYNLRQLRWLEHYLTGPGGEMPPYEIDYAQALAAH